MRLEIDAGGRKVTAEVADTNTSPKELLAELLAAWKATEGAKEPSQGPAFGFAHSGPTRFYHDNRARFDAGEQLPVRAEGEQQ